MKTYIPKPIDTSDIELSKELLELTEKLAENTHDVWAVSRTSQGWRYGEKRDEKKKETPCLVQYDELPDSEIEYERNAALATLKLILYLGSRIEKA